MFWFLLFSLLVQEGDVAADGAPDDRLFDLAQSDADMMGRSMINPHPGINTAEWRAETERVAARLLNSKSSGAGWAERLAEIRDRTKAVSGKADGEDSVLASVSGLLAHVTETSDAICRAERLLNTKQQYSDLSVAYKEYHKVSACVFVYYSEFDFCDLEFGRIGRKI
jgi:hypothetical protein